MDNNLYIEQDTSFYLNYIGKNRIKTPYIFLNLLNYGPNLKDKKCYYTKNNNIVNGIYYVYYDCVHFFTKCKKYPIAQFLFALKKLRPKTIMIVASDSTQTIIKKTLDKGWESTKNYVINLNGICGANIFHNCSVAKINDIKNVTKLLMTSKIYTDVYKENSLYYQLIERFKDKTGRTFIAREEKEVVASISTFAESKDIALLGALITDSKYRGRGYGSLIEKYATYWLLKHKIKTVLGFVNESNQISINFHKTIGAKFISSMMKYSKLNHSAIDIND